MFMFLFYVKYLCSVLSLKYGKGLDSDLKNYYLKKIKTQDITSVFQKYLNGKFAISIKNTMS